MHPVDTLEYVLGQHATAGLRHVSLGARDASAISVAVEIAAVRWGRWRETGEDIRPSLPADGAMAALDQLLSSRSGSALFSLSQRQAASTVFPALPNGELCDVPGPGDGWGVGQPFILFQERFKVALRQRGLASEPAHGLVGAFAEMASNAAEHALSEIPPVAAFETCDDSWTFSVTDVGCGVVESLRRNPAYAAVRDARKALALALQPGVSGTGEVGRGTGFTTLFKSLFDRNCTIRFRSASVAASCTATSPTDASLAYMLLPRRAGFHVAVTGHLRPPAG